MDDSMTRKDVLLAAGAVGAAGAAAVGAAGVIGLVSEDEDDGAQSVVAAYRSGGVPAVEPQSAVWDEAAELRAVLQPQQVAPPFLETAGVAELSVRAVHDGTELAFRLEWEDGVVDDLDGVRRYHDAVAVMLPAGTGAAPPPITMGAPGQPVHILQWRATWQRDTAEKTGVDQIYPRVVHDVMPDDVLPPETAELYWVGRAARNPLSQATRTSPVEQIVAEGFGSTTHVAQEARGVGVHADGRWLVALGFPLERPGVGAPLRPGTRSSVAFAVWLGHQENRGGRKHWAGWVPLQLQGAP